MMIPAKAAFYMLPTEDVEFRCDLHPRWSRDGRMVSIDSMHARGIRQIYLLDVSAITHPKEARKQ